MPDLPARNDAEAAALFRGRCFDCRSDHLYGIDQRRNFQSDGARLVERHRPGAEPGSGRRKPCASAAEASISNVPLTSVAVSASTPTRLTTDTCAPETGAPDESTTLPLMPPAERQGGIEPETGPTAFKSKYAFWLLPREPASESFGRSPDLRILGPVSLPIPLWNSGLSDRPSALTVAGLCWNYTSFPGTGGISTSIRVYTIFRRLQMRTSASQLTRLALVLAVAGWLLPAPGADTKPDKKKSQAALQRGKKADEAGKRDDAIAAYTEAVQADPSNVEAWRARGSDYQLARDYQKAQADFDKAIEIQPSGAENYLARADYFAAIGQAERAIHDYTLAINLKLERTEVYNARGKAYTEVRQFEKAEEDFTQAIILRLDNAEPYLGRGIARAEQRKISRRAGRFRFLHRTQAGSRGVPGGAGPGLHRHQRLHSRAYRSQRCAETEPGRSARMARARRRARAAE